MSNVVPPSVCRQIAHFLDNIRDYRQEIIDLAQSRECVVFYGCGRNQDGLFEYWNKYIGEKIHYCCDIDSSKWGLSFNGAICISPDELLARKDSCVVFVTIGNFGPVFKKLYEQGFSSVHLIYKYDLEASKILHTEPKNSINEKLIQSYALLSDPQSRKVFNAILERVLGDGSNINIMSDVCEGNQYFPVGLIELSDHESFVDGGAFDGDTISDFIMRTNAIFDKIYSFELDAINYQALEANRHGMPNRGRILTFNQGIWDEECDISYRIGSYQSSIGSGLEQGHVVPLDTALREQKVTMIKLDIEGAELNGLRGAKSIIVAQRPKLAICVYHEFNHLWEIPLYIKSLVPEYRIFLRHHTNLEYETVCYALP